MNIREIDLENIKKIGIYCITNLINGKKYVGKTGNKKGFIYRWKCHIWDLKNKKHSNYVIYKAFNKYGIDNFEFSIIEIVECINDIDELNNILNFWERYWINYYSTTNSDNGYNMTKGGEGTIGLKPWNKGLTKEMDKRLISWNKGLTKETDERLRIAGEKGSKIIREKGSHSGKNNGMFGIHRLGKLSPRFGHKLSKKTKEKISNTIIEKKLCKGKNNPNAKSIIQLTLDGRLVRKYDYIKLVEKYGFNYEAVKKCVNHKYITKLGNNIYGIRGKEKYIWLIS